VKIGHDKKKKKILAMCVLMKLDGWDGCTQMDGWMDEHILGYTCMHVVCH
jgi:hypothetical protein